MTFIAWSAVFFEVAWNPSTQHIAFNFLCFMPNKTLGKQQLQFYCDLLLCFVSKVLKCFWHSIQGLQFKRHCYLFQIVNAWSVFISVFLFAKVTTYWEMYSAQLVLLVLVLYSLNGLPPNGWKFVSVSVERYISTSKSICS